MVRSSELLLLVLTIDGLLLAAGIVVVVLRALDAGRGAPDPPAEDRTPGRPERPTPL